MIRFSMFAFTFHGDGLLGQYPIDSSLCPAFRAFNI
jgi:hypothetical protein